eukprot:2928238-Rhodomonas_salina.1
MMRGWECESGRQAGLALHVSAREHSECLKRTPHHALHIPSSNPHIPTTSVISHILEHTVFRETPSEIQPYRDDLSIGRSSGQALRSRYLGRHTSITVCGVALALSSSNTGSVLRVV